MRQNLKVLIVGLLLGCSANESISTRTAKSSQDADAKTVEIDTRDWSLAYSDSKFAVVGQAVGFDDTQLVVENPTLTYENGESHTTKGKAFLSISGVQRKLLSKHEGVPAIAMATMDAEGTHLALMGPDSKAENGYKAEGDFVTLKIGSPSTSLNLAGGANGESTTIGCSSPNLCTGLPASFYTQKGGESLKACKDKCSSGNAVPAPGNSGGTSQSSGDYKPPTVGRCSSGIPCGFTMTGIQQCCGAGLECAYTGGTPPMSCRVSKPQSDRCTRPSHYPCGPDSKGYRWCCANAVSEFCGPFPEAPCPAKKKPEPPITTFTSTSTHVDPPVQPPQPPEPPKPEQICGHGIYRDKPYTCGTTLAELKCCSVNEDCKTDFPGPRCVEREGPPLPPLPPTQPPVNPFVCRDRNRPNFCGASDRDPNFKCCAPSETCGRTSLGLPHCAPADDSDSGDPGLPTSDPNGVN